VQHAGADLEARRQQADAVEQRGENPGDDASDPQSGGQRREPAADDARAARGDADAGRRDRQEVGG
jgi:hypothetical protein